jgi:peptide subunit release factor 1 (eRF1)
MSELKTRLKKLAAVESTYPHILTVFARTRDGGRDRTKEAKIFLKNRIAEIDSVLAGDQRARQNLHKEAAVAAHILEQDIPAGTLGIALYIKGGEVFERFDTPFHFEDQVAYRRVPHISQLAFMDEEMEPLLIVALDSRSAHVFDVALGAAGSAHAEVQSHVTKHMRAGGLSKTHFQRRIDHQKHEHIADVAQQIALIIGRWNHKRIMVVGPDRSTAALLAMLTPDVKRRVIERKAMDAKSTDAQITEEALHSFMRAETEEETAKMRRVRIEIHSSRMGVAGVDQVIKCLNLGQCYEILMAHDFAETGAECQVCGAVTVGAASRTGSCSSCDAAKSNMKDLVLREYITRKALQYNVELEYMKIPEFRETLGPIAALLHSPLTTV